MLQRKSGHFVVVSSLVGLFGTPLRSAYAASKHALHGFFESMQAEVWQDNIFVSMVCPGFIRTEISTKALTGDGTAHTTLDPALASGMPADVCARKIIQGIKQRKAQIVVGGKETMGVWVKRFFPALFRRTIRRVKVI
jgi:short-subunit dehydrogenase